MTQRITYTTLGSSEEFHREFEAAAQEVRKNELGRTHPNRILGARSVAGREAEIRSPIDTRIVLGATHEAPREEASRAVEAAHAAFAGWRNVPWEARVEIFDRVAAAIAERKYRLAAWMALETGKNRLEAMGEVEESVDLVRYYAQLMRDRSGYEQPMARLSPTEETKSVFRPYGAWAVISPFNFPLALSVGMMSGALLTGNTVVFKPSHDARITSLLLVEAMLEAGVPENVLHFVSGGALEVGETITTHRLTQGIAFTGSYEVGMHLHRRASEIYPKPVIVEMGGKNPALVMKSADLDAAAEGVMRSAFGYGGQKCSACSRAYVHHEVMSAFLAKLVERTKALKIGDPLERDVYLGPVINHNSVEKFERYVDRLRRAKIDLAAGGRVLTQGTLAHGHYVEPTIAVLEDKDDPLFEEEMFLPILLVASVDGIDEALRLSNRSKFGLTAGLFSRDTNEVEAFLDEIEAGVTYVNRRTGATTGAWPGVNPFGGWKASGSTGPAGLGPHYLLKFMREQSRTVNP